MDITKLNSDLNSMYNLGAKIHQVYEIVSDTEGDITDEQWEQLQCNYQECKQLGQDTLYLKTILEGQSNTIQNEINRLTLLKEKRDKQVANIEKALLYILLNFGEQDKKGIWRLSLETAELSSAKNPDSVEIIEEALVPNEFKKFDYLIKDLNKQELDYIIKILSTKEILDEPIEINQDNIKITQKVVKKDLKPKLEELDIKVENLVKQYNEEVISEEDYKIALEALPSYGAQISKGKIRLKIQ